MPSKFTAYAASAMKTLATSFFSSDTPSQWGAGGNFWKTPTICREIITSMTLAGNTNYLQTILNAGSVGQPNIGSCGYLDDETCWGNFYVTGYLFLKNLPGQGQNADQFLQNAQAVYTDLKNNWDDTCGGGLWWRRSPPSYPLNVKAANSTLGLMEIALELYAAGQASDGLTWAKKCWSWIQDKGLVTGGLVFGGLTSTCVPDPHNGPVIALQGNPLYSLWLMYQATQDTSCLDTAVGIADATIRQMVWPTANNWSAQAAILMAKPDPIWDGSSSDQSTWGNEAMFKGIFAGYLGLFTANLATVAAYQANATTYAQVFAANADALIANFPQGVYGMNWQAPQTNYQPTGNGGIDASLQYGALSVFNAAVRTNSSN